MLILGIITLFLTGFMLVYYGYLSRHTDRDVSFFLSVGIISMFMNLCTNASENARVLAVLYLIVAVLFIGLGFAVSVEKSLAFYTSIGPWFKKTFTDKENIGWNLLAACVPFAGVVLYGMKHKEDRYFSDRCGKLGAWSIVIWLLLLWLVLGAI